MLRHREEESRAAPLPRSSVVDSIRPASLAGLSQTTETGDASEPETGVSGAARRGIQSLRRDGPIWMPATVDIAYPGEPLRLATKKAFCCVRAWERSATKPFFCCVRLSCPGCEWKPPIKRGRRKRAGGRPPRVRSAGDHPAAHCGWRDAAPAEARAVRDAAHCRRSSDRALIRPAAALRGTASDGRARWTARGLRAARGWKPLPFCNSFRAAL